MRTVNEVYQRLRHRLVAGSPVPAELNGAVELDGDDFGPRLGHGKLGQATGGKTIVFGLLKRDGSVFTEIVHDWPKKTLQAIIGSKIDAVAMADGGRGCEKVMDVGFDRHFRGRHGKDKFVFGTSHINGIDFIWSFAKARLQQFNGVPKHSFLLHLKEPGFRFNHRHEGLYNLLLKSQHPL